MKLDGDKIVGADRSTVWTVLQNPEFLQKVIPGCSQVTGSVEDGFDATVKQKIGPVSATFKCIVRVTDLVTGESCTIAGEGKGGVAGFAKGHVKLRLSDSNGGTKIEYWAEGHFGGKIAQLGSRLLGGVAKKLTAKFFANFDDAVISVQGPRRDPA